jgi:hypothetical protein
VTPAEPVVRRVQQWAQAFVTGDAVALAEVTGDTLGRQFQAMGGFQNGGVEVVTAVAKPSGEELVVRARVRLVRANQFNTSAEYDLLVTGYTTSDPKVVAWGPAGSGPVLAPYQNTVRQPPVVPPAGQ